MERYTITILDGRAPDFEAVLGTATLPIVSPTIETISLGELGPAWCVQVDLEALEEEQRERLLNYMAGYWGVTRAEIEQSVAEHGLPMLLGESEINIEKDDAPATEKGN